MFGAVNPSGKLRGKVRNSYFAQSDEQYSPVIGAEGSVADAVSLSAEQMKTAQSFNGFDFDGVWAINEGDSCPHVIIEDRHEHAYTASVIPAECEKDESTVYTCALCGHSYTEVKEGTATGHKWGEWTYNNDATEEADGTKTRKCEYCGKEETVTAEGTRIELEDSSKRFTDVQEGRWYKGYIDYVATYKLMNGMSETTFEPNGKLIRAQFVQILANMSGVDTSNRDVETVFEDVPADRWYTPAVKWASDNGIVDGMEPTKFAPMTEVQRQQICTMIVRYANYAGIALDAKVDKMVFADADRIQNYAEEAVVICQRAGIIDGMDGENNTKIFAPRDSATRAQVAAMMTRFHENFAN